MKKILKKFFIYIFYFFFNKLVTLTFLIILDFKYILNESVAGKKAQNALKNKLDKGFKKLKIKKKNYKMKKKK